MKRVSLSVLLALMFASMSLVYAGAGVQRSPEWPSVRKAHLKLHPVCELCGTRKSRQVHHIKPFHLYPDLELEESNLITLCDSHYWGINCHLEVAHGGNPRYENPNLLEDIAKLKVIASPGYIRVHGTNDRDAYIKEIHTRCKALYTKNRAAAKTK